MSQCQCGRTASQPGYRSSPWWAVTPPTSESEVARSPSRQVPKDPWPLTPAPEEAVVSSRITIPFGKLFASGGYVSYPLLTLTPLYLGYPFLARLACLSPAASVRSEPGSNSSKSVCLLLYIITSYQNSKELI